MRRPARPRAVRTAPERYILPPRPVRSPAAAAPPVDSDFTPPPPTVGMEKVSLAEAFGSFDETWSPRLAGELNGQAVKLAKADGEFVWHSHADADELFLVNGGRLRIEFREADDVVLEEGEFTVVPRGTEHRPVAEPEAEILLFEPSETRNTGDVETDETVTDLERLD